MCWNWQVSLGTYLVASTVSAYCWKRNNVNDRYLIVWLMVFSFIQFIEFLMWIDEVCSFGLNDFATKLSYSAIWAQPLVLWILAPMAKGEFYFFSKRTMQIIGMVVVFPIFVNSIIFPFFLDKTQSWCSSPGPNCHMAWYYVVVPVSQQFGNPLLRAFSYFGLEDYAIVSLEVLFVIMLCTPTTLLKSPGSKGLAKYNGQLIGIVGVLTAVLTALYVGAAEFTSLWCWVSASLSFCQIFVNSKIMLDKSHS